MGSLRMAWQANSHAWVSATVVGVVAVSLAALGCSGSASNTSNGREVKVTQDSKTVASLENQTLAAERASQLAEFEVLPVESLPSGFVVEGFDVRRAIPRSPARQVEVSIRSDRGGLLVAQLNSRAVIASEAEPLTVGEPGEYYRFENGSGHVQYYLLTEDRTYTIFGRSTGAITDDEAVRVLRAFLD